MGIDCPPSIWEITVTLAACKFAGFITVDTIVNPPFVSQASLVSADCPPPTWEFTMTLAVCKFAVLSRLHHSGHQSQSSLR